MNSRRYLPQDQQETQADVVITKPRISGYAPQAYGTDQRRAYEYGASDPRLRPVSGNQ